MRSPPAVWDYVHPSTFFDALEPRQYHSNPTIVDFTVDTPEAYPGKVITLTAHANADLGVGVRAVVFWIEDNSDALNQFIANGSDQPLGDVRAPDIGTTNQFSLRVTVGASWQSTAAANMKFGVDVVDNNGNYSRAPILFVTIDAKQKPFVRTMRAEPASGGGGDIRLIATTTTNGMFLTSTGISGVTFFLDQNGNNQWDVGTDIDLGLGTMTGDGVYEKTITPQLGWNLTWFTASAFDTRSSSDRFGPNHSTVLRADASAPEVTYINSERLYVHSSDQTERFYAAFSAPATLLGVTFFHDINRNGLWDVGIDVPLEQNFSAAGTLTGSVYFFQNLGQLGHGWQSIGIAAHDASGRGDDSWSAVMTVWLNINNMPWVDNASLSQNPVPVGTQTVDLSFRVHDDDGVMGIRRAKVTRYFSGGGFGDTGVEGTNLVYLTPGRTNALWQLSFNTGNLPAGNYSVDIWVNDYRHILGGPRTIVNFSVV